MENQKRKKIKKIKSELKSEILRFISYKPRTMKEAYNAGDKYLLEYELSAEEKSDLIKEVLVTIQEAGYLDDLDYARSYILEQQKRSQPHGPYYVSQFLRKKGVSRDVIRKALDKYFTPEKEKECIEKLISKKNYEASYKLVNYLLQRGFTKHLVYSLVDSDGKNT